MKPVYCIASSVVSPMGLGTTENFNNVIQQKSALALKQFNFTEEPFYVSAIESAWLEDEFKTVSLNRTKTYSTLEKMCVLAIEDVLKKSQINIAGEDVLLIFSSTKGNIDYIRNEAGKVVFHPKLLLHSITDVLQEHFKLVHEPLIISNACISGVQALITGMRHIAANQIKHVVVIGADLVSEFTVSGFKSLNALSSEACKPFDAERKGINLGEAAACIVLSSEKNCYKENCHIQLMSGAIANDAHHISAPSRNGEGLYKAIKQTLDAFDVNSIDFINAHGTATLFNDEMEAQALTRSDLQHIQTNSLKAYYGHTLGAAGILETILSTESLVNNKTIVSKNYFNNGVSLPLNLITISESKELLRCLKIASGFGGCNAALLIEKN